METAPCKLYISTIFNSGSLADEGTEVAEFVSLHSWTFTVLCYTDIYKKVQKLRFFFKKEGICTFLFWCKIKGSKDPGIGVKIPAVLRKLT